MHAVTKTLGTARRALPSVDRLLGHAAFRELKDKHGRPMLLDTLRTLLAEQRARLASAPQAQVPDDETLALECATRLEAQARPSLRAVFNLTGTVLHTNLGRALYPQAAIDAATAAMGRAVNLEYDLEGAGRGERDAHVEEWILKLTGAQAALVVNNNAAAVYLALNTLAAGKEVIVSRGELVEIGGAFRIPDIMASSGCMLREVGTTNRTHPHDYERAIGANTAALMKVHASNYEIRGFTAEVSPKELSQIARAKGLPLIHDLGCGMLLDLETLGLPHEATPREAIADGAGVVTFSGDKLLGGPQCGIVVGDKELIARMRKNPMKRALRLDKVRLAALEAVLRLYGDPDRIAQTLPTLRLLTRKREDIAQQAQRLLAPLQAAFGDAATVSVADCASQIGSGALPVETLPSAGIRIAPAGLAKGARGKGKAPRGEPGADDFANAMRALPVPVVGRVRDGALELDLRCLDDEAGFVAQLERLELPGALA